MNGDSPPAPGPEYWFYHLEREGHDLRLHDLLALAVARKWRCLIHGPSLAQMKALDASLWTIRPDSFLPHGMAGSDRDDLQPVLLSAADGPAPKNDRPREVYVALSGIGLPTGPGAFQRIILLFEGRNEPALAAARSAFRHARELGNLTRYFRENEAGKWEEQKRG